MAHGEDIMNRFFDWAVFGEIDRRHDLIHTSLSEETRDRLNELAALSDRPSFEPYLSGFPYERWYVLMRIFSDPTAARGGMVRSFCLFLPIDEIDRINDLSIPIGYLPNPNSSSFEWNGWKCKDSAEKAAEQEPDVLANITSLSIRLGFIDAILNNNLPGVWTQSQDEFESAIVSIWALLPPVFRRILCFGRSNSSNDLGTLRLHFITTSKNPTARWKAANILTSLDREPNSRAENFLLGNSSANSLAQFLSLLPALSEFHQLKLADRCLEAFEDAQRGEINQAVAAARLLGRLAPELHQAEELKERLLSILETLLQATEIKDIRYFANLNLCAFINAEQHLVKLLTALVNRHFEVFHNLDRELIEWAFDKNTVLWWKKSVSGAIEEQVRQLSIELASNLWDWCLNDPKLVLPLQEHLPSDADLLLYQSAPTKIDKEQANSLLEMFSQSLNSQSNAFPRLLTYLGVRSEVPNDRILQTCLGRSSDVDIALNVFRKCIGDRVFLDLALTVSDERMFIKAGNCCFEDPTLLARILPDNVYWRKIWLAAIQAGADPLAGILQPNQVIATVLDEFLVGETVDKNLLIALSHTPVANLIDYSSRTEIWSKLPLEAKGGFLEATAKGVFDRWRDDSNFQPEPELNQSILKLGCFTEAVRQSDRGLNEMISGYIALVVSANGSSSNAEEIIQAIHEKSLNLPQVKIEQLANWIRQNNFKKIAEMGLECYKKTKNTALCVFLEHTYTFLPFLKVIEATLILKDNHRDIPYDPAFDRKKQKLDALKKQWDLQNEQLTRMRRDRTIESYFTRQFQLDEDIKKAQIELEKLEQELKSMEL
jgi:GTPase-associated protein 1, N-terminal domain type 1